MLNGTVSQESAAKAETGPELDDETIYSTPPTASWLPQPAVSPGLSSNA